MSSFTYCFYCAHNKCEVRPFKDKLASKSDPLSKIMLNIWRFCHGRRMHLTQKRGAVKCFNEVEWWFLTKFGGIWQSSTAKFTLVITAWRRHTKKNWVGMDQTGTRGMKSKKDLFVESRGLFSRAWVQLYPILVWDSINGSLLMELPTLKHLSSYVGQWSFTVWIHHALSPLVRTCHE